MLIEFRMDLLKLVRRFIMLISMHEFYSVYLILACISFQY